MGYIMINVGVIGAGGWGLALANIFSEKHNVKVWVHSEDSYKLLSTSYRNDNYLENIQLKDEIIVISGMGTKTIQKILNFNIINDLILSSHTNIEDLKQFLEEKQYYIYKELIIDDGKTYNIIYAKHKGGAT